ncbi:MAG: hypothetical protein V7711_12135 [Pseudomonadales bacterium]
MKYAKSPFRSEKNITWEGGFRVPTLVRWPGKGETGSTSNDIMSHLDRAPYFYKSAVVVGTFMKTFREYPPSQAPQSSDPGKFR